MNTIRDDVARAIADVRNDPARWTNDDLADAACEEFAKALEAAIDAPTLPGLIVPGPVLDLLADLRWKGVERG